MESANARGEDDADVPNGRRARAVSAEAREASAPAPAPADARRAAATRRSARPRIVQVALGATALRARSRVRGSRATKETRPTSARDPENDGSNAQSAVNHHEPRRFRDPSREEIAFRTERGRSPVRARTSCARQGTSAPSSREPTRVTPVVARTPRTLAPHRAVFAPGSPSASFAVAPRGVNVR